MSVETLSAKRIEEVRAAIRALPRLPSDDWPWIGGMKRLNKKRANKYLFACILNYQMNADLVWERCKTFIIDDLNDPDSLWEIVTGYTLARWLGKTRNRLHRFQDKAHQRVWHIGKRVLLNHNGDARNIWREKKARDVVTALEELGVGPNLSRMTVGGLLDTHHIKGKSDVKADIHVRRVLGRIFYKQTVGPDEAIALARKLSPRNPWRIDGPMFRTGKNNCHANDPDCSECPMQGVCGFNA